MSALLKNKNTINSLLDEFKHKKQELNATNNTEVMRSYALLQDNSMVSQEDSIAENMEVSSFNDDHNKLYNYEILDNIYESARKDADEEVRKLNTSAYGGRKIRNAFNSDTSPSEENKAMVVNKEVDKTLSALNNAKYLINYKNDLNNIQIKFNIKVPEKMAESKKIQQASHDLKVFYLHKKRKLFNQEKEALKMKKKMETIYDACNMIQNNPSHSRKSSTDKKNAQQKTMTFTNAMFNEDLVKDSTKPTSPNKKQPIFSPPSSYHRRHHKKNAHSIPIPECITEAFSDADSTRSTHTKVIFPQIVPSSLLLDKYDHSEEASVFDTNVRTNRLNDSDTSFGSSKFYSLKKKLINKQMYHTRQNSLSDKKRINPQFLKPTPSVNLGPGGSITKEQRLEHEEKRKELIKERFKAEYRKIDTLIKNCETEKTEGTKYLKHFDQKLHAEVIKQENFSNTVDILKEIEYADVSALGMLYFYKVKDMYDMKEAASEVSKEYRSGMMDPCREVAKFEKQAVVKKNIGKKQIMNKQR